MEIGPTKEEQLEAGHGSVTGKAPPKQTSWRWVSLVLVTIVLASYVVSIADDINDRGLAEFLMPFSLGVGVMSWIWVLVSDVRRMLNSK